MPGDAWSPRRRDERIAATLAGLRAGREAAQAAEEARVEEYRARRQAGERAGCPPAPAAVAMAEENLARVRAARAARLARLEERYAAGQPRRGRAAGIDDHCRVKEAGAKLEAARARAAEADRKAAGRAADRKGPGPVRNITDPDSRLMPVRGGGFIQGYNTQNMPSQDGLIIATELTGEQAGCPSSEPMLAKGQQAAALIAAHRRAPAPGHPGHARAAENPRGDRGLPAAGPHRRDPARPHQAISAGHLTSKALATLAATPA